MKRIGAAAFVLCVGSVGSIALGSAGAGAASVSVKVSPSTNLVNGQSVTISGKGLVNSYHGKAQTWFVTECTSAVQGHLNPSTDTPHCDINHAIALKVGHNGSATAHYHVLAGIVGDGYCGTAGHLTCVIGVGTAQGLGTVIHITFKNATPATSGATTTG
ncbi:MAG TPA: hypothetical protein VMF35_18500 [Acidimicrobiales bacterium]|nr:hypothetical protein [Acidimicrobiales bacterium]